MPLMRACYESGLTAARLVQNPEGIRGSVNEEARPRVGPFDQHGRFDDCLVREGSQSMALIDGVMIESGADTQESQMHQLCNSLQGGYDAYLYYRFMTSSACISAHTVDQYQYIEETDPEESGGVRLLTEAEPIGA